MHTKISFLLSPVERVETLRPLQFTVLEMLQDESSLTPLGVLALTLTRNWSSNQALTDPMINTITSRVMGSLEQCSLSWSIILPPTQYPIM